MVSALLMLCIHAPFARKCYNMLWKATWHAPVEFYTLSLKTTPPQQPFVQDTCALSKLCNTHTHTHTHTHKTHAHTHIHAQTHSTHTHTHSHTHTHTHTHTCTHNIEDSKNRATHTIHYIPLHTQAFGKPSLHRVLQIAILSSLRPPTPMVFD